MKKLMIGLWLIIITGIVFIGIKFTKPDSNPDDVLISQESHENLPPIDDPSLINDKTVNDTPQDATYTQLMTLGENSFKAGNYETAIQNYLYAINQNPNSSDPLIKVGEAYLANNEPKKAEEFFRKAADIDPDSNEILLGIARSLLNNQNIEQAKSLVWKMDKENAEVKYYTGVLLILYKDFEGAKNNFEELAKNETTPYLVKAKAQKFIDAYTTFSYFSEGETLHLQTLLAKALTQSGENAAAIPLLFDVIDQKNNYRDAWIILGYAYLKTDKIAEAIDSLEQAKSLQTDKPETLFYLGLAYFANNDLDKAIYYLEQADSEGYQPKEELNLKLGDAYLLKEKFEKAEAHYNSVLATNTGNLNIFVRAIWLNIDKLDNATKAVELAQKALEVHPEEAMSYNLLGWSYTATGNFQEAEQYLNQALSLNPDFDAAILNLGWLKEKQGKTVLAKEYYKKAYNLGNGNSIASLAAKRYNNITSP